MNCPQVSRITSRLLPSLLVLSCIAGAVAGEPQRDGRERVVFHSEREEDGNGIVTRSSVQGDLDEQARQRVARPWSYFDEDVLYHEEAWAISDDDETIRRGYRVWTTPNHAPVRPQATWGPPEVEADLETALREAVPGDLLPVTLDVRNAPAWDVPLRQARIARGAADLAEGRRQRQAALERRRGRIRQQLIPVVEHVKALGGEVTAEGTLSGWITARVPAAGLPELLRRNDLRRASLLRGRFEPHNWNLGEIRSDSYIDARQFIDAGYDGEQPNPARHGFGDITVGVVETGPLENEACFLYDGADCTGTSRLQELFRCDDFDRDGNYCEPVSDFRDTDENATHGTLVASTILGDYRQGQGDPYALGDANWDPILGHDAGWESQATGIAPEARLIYFGQVADNDSDDGTTTAPSFADAYDDAIDRAVDITNSSWGWTTGSGQNCSVTAVQPHEQELENAFDDGILMVVSAGNPNVGFCAGNVGTPCGDDGDCTNAGLAGPCTSDSVCADDPGTSCSVNADCSNAGVSGPCIAHTSACNLGSPADVPKAFAVNSLNGSESVCDLAYTNCPIDPNFSANGGVNGVVNGALCAGCLTGVDMAAPNRNAMTTSAAGLHGSATFTFAGTSAAGPVVAGAAALVKDWLLTAGQTWINSPGRLHTVMLAMGDRTHGTWGGATSTLGVNASPLFGMGRLKLRLFDAGSSMDPWGYNMRLQSFTAATADVVYLPFATPMPTGTVMAKCVLMQDEDMSAKSDISRIDLEVRLRDPVAGACDSSGTLRYTWIDAGTEIKKMSAITDAETTLAGRCLEVTLDKEHVTSQGITTHAFCYYAGVLDRFSAPD